MKLLLVRHGHADPAEMDAARPLSRRGRREVETLALFLGTSGVRVEQVFHSGLTRAEETAEILAGSICRTHRADAVAGLLPDEPTDAIVSEIASWEDPTLLVGHLPHIQRLATRLLAISPPSRLPFAFHPATIVGLEGDGTSWTLEWLLKPELFGRSDLLL